MRVNIKVFLFCFLFLHSVGVQAEGYKIINPNKPLQEQFAEENTTYLINANCDLNGQTLIFPKGTVLVFQGGILANGNILNSNFYVEASRERVFENITFSLVDDDELEQISSIKVRIKKDNLFFNIETDAIAKKGDVVNYRSLYKLTGPFYTSPKSDGIRTLNIDNKSYVVSDQWNNYTYPTRVIVGVDKRNGKLLKEEIIPTQYEVFYTIKPIVRKSVTTFKNREVYPEWFGCEANSSENQSEALNIGVSVATDSRAVLLLTSGSYCLKSPLIATTNTKIIGIESSPWNVCTNLAVETNTGLIVFDEKGCNNVLIEGLSFSANSKSWVERYTGIEVRTSIQGMVLKNISCYQPEIGIYMHAYSDLMSASIENYKQLSGVYGIEMQPLFKTTFKSAYCNGNMIEIGTGGSEFMKKNALYIKNCKGNSICYNAGEQYGNPSVYCDNSVLTITGISWHEESVFLQAVNNSIVNIIGDIFAMGTYLADESSIINQSGQIYSFYGHSIINSNYHVNSYKDIRFASLDPRHNAFLDWNGNVAFEINENEVFYVNGIPYFSKDEAAQLITPYDKTKGMTVFMRISSSGKPSKKSPIVALSGEPIFVFNPSTTFPVCCINSSMDYNQILGYLNKGESIWSFYIIGDKVYTMNDIEVGTIKVNSDEVLLEWRSESETAFMVSEVLFVDGVINDNVKVRDYERYLINAPRSTAPQTGKVRPILSQTYVGHLFYDETIGHVIMWDGEKWKNIDGTDIK